MKISATILLAASLVLTTAPAFAINYPVSGDWGESSETEPGPIDCTGKRQIRFEGVQRFDSNGGVPYYRVKYVVQEGNASFRVTEEFDTAQINARITYSLNLIDPDRIEIVMSPGGILPLKRCA